MDGRLVSHSFRDLLETFGDLNAFQGLPTGREDTIEFVAEYHDTRAAENVVSTLNRTTMDVSDAFPDFRSFKWFILDCTVANLSPLLGLFP